MNSANRDCYGTGRLKPYGRRWRRELALTPALSPTGTIQSEKSSPSPRPSPPGRGGIFACPSEGSLFGKVRELNTASVYLRPYISLRGAPIMRYQGDEAAQIETELRWQ